MTKHDRYDRHDALSPPAIQSRPVAQIQPPVQGRGRGQVQGGVQRSNPLSQPHARPLVDSSVARFAGTFMGTLGLWTAGISLATLAGCANYAGIHSDKQVSQIGTLQAAQSLPAQGGAWPTMDWPARFGDPQLTALINEALADSPSIAQAQARINSAMAYTANANAGLFPHVGANYSLKRELYSGNALYPPPYGGSWYTENNGGVSASYELDLWGKNSAGLAQAISQERASIAQAEEARVTLAAQVAQAYSALARQYALLNVARAELQQREDIGRISASRFSAGLDTQVETRTSEADVATSRTQITQLEGGIVVTRYQLGALLGKGPDRGLAIAIPQIADGAGGAGASDNLLPNDLPANLLSRRPDIVAARWQVDAALGGIKVGKAAFYPNINLSAAFGFDAFGFKNFLKFGSREIQAGPAIDLPIFDAGALRAMLKTRYAAFDSAVATYNDTLIQALNQVATQVAQIHSTQDQQRDTQAAYSAAQKAYQLAVIRYKGGLSTQLQVLDADRSLLAQREAVVSLEAQRRDQQIALIKAMGGGFTANDQQKISHTGAIKGSE